MSSFLVPTHISSNIGVTNAIVSYVSPEGYSLFVGYVHSTFLYITRDVETDKDIKTYQKILRSLPPNTGNKQWTILHTSLRTYLLFSNYLSPTCLKKNKKLNFYTSINVVSEISSTKTSIT